MRIFSIQNDGRFEEFSQTHFHLNYEETVLENWLESNSDDILEDGKLLIIGRQITTNLGSIIDLLGIDREGNTVVMELKRHRTPRDTLAQALEYASFIEELDTKQLEQILQRYVNDEALSLAMRLLLSIKNSALFLLDNGLPAKYDKLPHSFAGKD